MRSESNYTFWRSGNGVALCDKDDEICVLAMKAGILASPSSVKSICREEDIARTDEVSSLKSEVAPVVNVGYAPCSRLVRC